MTNNFDPPLKNSGASPAIANGSAEDANEMRLSFIGSISKQFLLLMVGISYPISELLITDESSAMRLGLKWASIACSALGLILTVKKLFEFIVNFLTQSDNSGRTAFRVGVFMISSVILMIIMFANLLYWQRANIERCCESYADSLYFSVITITTTGFGDCFPRTAEAKLISAAEALCGYFMLGLLISSAANIIAVARKGK